MWRFVNLLQVGCVAVWSAGWISLALLVRWLSGGPRQSLVMARRLWAPGILLTAGARLEREGLERVDFTRPHLFVANHQSLLDIPVLFRSLPVPLRFVAKQELRRVPFLGRYIAAMGMVYVQPESRVRGVDAMEAAAALLAAGASVATFPEGTRGVGDRVSRFKPGALAAAIQAGVEVVPVAIDGAGRVLPRGGFQARPGTIRLRVGDPIPTAGLSLENRAELACRVRDEVQRLLGESGSAAPAGGQGGDGDAAENHQAGQGQA